MANNVRCYVDDVVIFFWKWGRTQKHLEKGFGTLNGNGLRLRIRKCSFMQSSLHSIFLIVDKHDIHVDEEKTSKIEEASPPITRKGPSSFLGSTSFHLRFLPSFSNMRKPLNENPLEKVTFIWTKKCKNPLMPWNWNSSQTLSQLTQIIRNSFWFAPMLRIMPLELCSPNWTIMVGRILFITPVVCYPISSLTIPHLKGKLSWKYLHWKTLGLFDLW